MPPKNAGQTKRRSRYPVAYGGGFHANGGRAGMIKKVLLAASSFSGGGAEHVALRNLQALCRSPGYEVAVYTCQPQSVPPWPGLRIYPARDFRQEKGLALRTGAALGIAENAAMLRRCFREFSPDIVHLHDYIPFTPTFLHALAQGRQRYGYRVLLTHHTYSYLCTNDMLYSFPRAETCERCLGRYDSRILRERCAGSWEVSAAKYLQKKRIKGPLRAAIDLHIAPSAFLRQLLLRAFPALDVRLVHNPCIARVNMTPPREKTGDVLYFGRISREKGLLWAARHFLEAEPGRRLYILGDGPQAPELSRLLEGQGRVQFQNRFLPTGELLPLVEAARFFLLPSLWYENSPVSLVEAVNAYAVPVVSRLGGMREICEELGVGHFFEPGDPESLRHALKEALFAGRANSAALQNARGPLERFTEAAHWRELDAIYRTL